MPQTLLYPTSRYDRDKAVYAGIRGEPHNLFFIQRGNGCDGRIRFEGQGLERAVTYLCGGHYYVIAELGLMAKYEIVMRVRRPRFAAREFLRDSI